MFYISSRGSSANEWLAKMLSKHPRIVCFRSTRSFPPYETHEEECTADKFIKGLLECEKATYGEKIFGSIHGYHGIEAKHVCESNGGFFGYTIRHPISRIHSAFIYYMDVYFQRKGIKVANKDIHDYVCSEIQLNRDLSEYLTRTRRNLIPDPRVGWGMQAKPIITRLIPETIKKGIRPILRNKRNIQYALLAKEMYNIYKNKHHVSDESKLGDYTAWLFSKLAGEFLRLDRELYDNCSLAQSIKMEEMTQSTEYFKSRVAMQIAPSLEWSDEYLRNVISGEWNSESEVTHVNYYKVAISKKRFNVHRSAPISPQEIWKTWPEGMRRIIMRYFDTYNIGEICNSFDYDITYL